MLHVGMTSRTDHILVEELDGGYPQLRLFVRFFSHAMQVSQAGKCGRPLSSDATLTVSLRLTNISRQSTDRFGFRQRYGEIELLRLSSL